VIRMSLSTAAVGECRDSNLHRPRHSNLKSVPIQPLGPTHPPTKWGPVVLAPRVKRPGRQSDHSSPMPRLKIRGAIPPSPNVSSWHDA